MVSTVVIAFLERSDRHRTRLTPKRVHVTNADGRESTKGAIEHVSPDVRVASLRGGAIEDLTAVICRGDRSSSSSPSSESVYGRLQSVRLFQPLSTVNGHVRREVGGCQGGEHEGRERRERASPGEAPHSRARRGHGFRPAPHITRTPSRPDEHRFVPGPHADPRASNSGHSNGRHVGGIRARFRKGEGHLHSHSRRGISSVLAYHAGLAVVR